VTVQRSLEHQLQQAQRMEAVGRLSGGIAHDFNNLLTIIGGLTSLTARRLPEGSQERRDLEQVVEAAGRASSLTQQLLTFSRRQMSSTEVLDLNPIVRGLEPLFRRLLGEHIILQAILAHDLGRTRGNRTQLEQVVMNLVLNARDAMPAGGTLTVRTENVQVAGTFAHERLRLRPGPHVVLSVSDTGVGMDATTMANIFEPFFTTKEPGKGTGLGLATVYAVVQQAGGAVYVYSEPGRGSVFKVYLPQMEVTPPAVAAPAPQATVTVVESESTILLVEDERGVRSFTAQVLEEAGYRVLQAGSGEEALALVTDRPEAITLLLTDVVMPGINGRTLAERLRLLYPGVAVLYTSGYTDDMVLRAGVVAESAAFLQKPYTHQTLLERVRATIASERARAAG
jgi:nitrogen-specific signal transduction histidine kinase/CheY-like chemotaxis protein